MSLLDLNDMHAMVVRYALFDLLEHFYCKVKVV